MRVASVGERRLRVDLLVPLEGRVLGLAERAAEVDVLHDQTPAGLEGGDHRGDAGGRVGQVGEHEACVHHVVLRVADPVGEVGDPELDVGDLGLLGVAAGEVDLGGVEVDAHGRTGDADEGGQVEGDVATATADVEAAHPCRHAGAFQQRQGGRPHHASQHAQPLAALDTSADQVVVVVHRQVTPGRRTARAGCAARRPAWCGPAREDRRATRARRPAGRRTRRPRWPCLPA